MIFNNKGAGYISILALCSAPWFAEANSDIRINGFGSIAAGYANDTTTFRNSDYESLLEFKPGSRFGLQMTADLGDGLAATAQVLAKGEDDFKPEFEWAYLSYDVAENTTARAGRLRIPFYKYSDFLDVGYAYTFVTPPKAMYSLEFSSFDGLGLIHRFELGDYELSANVNFGTVDDTFFESTTPTDGKLENFAGINLQMSRDFFSAYVAYFRAELEIPVALIETAAADLEAFGATPEQASSLKIDGDEATFIGAGFSFDYEDIIVNAEYSQIEVKNALDLVSDEWYLMAGYRMGLLTPYMIYETTENKRNTTTASTFSPLLAPSVQDAYDSLRFGYDGMTLGVRYDFHHSAALKVQFTRFDGIYDVSSGYGSLDDKESLNSFLTSIDFVF